MFLICFVRDDLKHMIDHCTTDTSAKGKGMVITKLGNKGGVALSFNLSGY